MSIKIFNYFSSIAIILIIPFSSYAATINFTGTFDSSNIFNGTFEPIQTIELSSTSSEIKFTDIPSKYKIIKLVYSIGHGDQGGGQARMTFNNDTASTYKHYIKSLWSTLSSGVDNIGWIYLAHTSPGTEGLAVGECLISNPTNHYKRATGTWSDMDGTAGYSFFGMISGVWKNSSDKIHTITIQSSDGSNQSFFASGSRVTLLGIQ